MILKETLQVLRHNLDLSNIVIRDIYVSNFFNAIQLSDDSVGACMCYASFSTDASPVSVREDLLGMLQSDPLLIDYLFSKSTCDLLKLSLQACVVSALSQKPILESADISRSDDMDVSFFDNAASAVVVGFGGYLDYIVTKTAIDHIVVTDLLYGKPDRHEWTSFVNASLDRYKKAYPQKSVIISTDCTSTSLFAKADLVSITGSALCNGTLDGLLKKSSDCKKIILQGQSAAIYPVILFDKGISVVATTIKPQDMLSIAMKDYPKFKSLLEGGLPWIFLTPRTPVGDS